MQESELQKIREIKSRVRAMLEERHQLQTGDGSVALPSAYWSDFCESFDYLLGLEEQYYSKLRLHTYHLTGDAYQFYYFTDPNFFRHGIHLKALTAGIPPAYVLNEPEGGIGFRYEDNRFISLDIARLQRAVSTLYRHGVFSGLPSGGGERAYVLEIGGGYGSLAHHLSNIIRNVTYFIVDLPETLLFSASYLSLLNPQKKIYLYDSSDFPALVESGDLSRYDFVLIPNYKLRSLSRLRFNLAINIASLQEMRTVQAEEYLDFIRETCEGIFYSWNEDRQSRNQEMSNVSELLSKRFELLDVTTEQLFDDSVAEPQQQNSKRALRSALGKAKRTVLGRSSSNNSPRTPPTYTTPHYREYLCKPLPTKRDAER